MATAKSHRDLRVHQLAFVTAAKIHEITKSFPPEEKYSLTDQIRRSSRDHINSQLTIMMSEPNKWTPRTSA